MTKAEVYTIESKVPIPAGNSVPLDSLEVGDSVLFPLNKRASVQTIASRLKKDTKKEFKVKKINEQEARVWRTK